MTSSGVCQAHSCELVCEVKGLLVHTTASSCLSCRPAEVLCKVFANLSLLSCDYFLLFLLTGHSCLSLSLSPCLSFHKVSVLFFFLSVLVAPLPRLREEDGKVRLLGRHTQWAGLQFQWG